jgi:hypothetical protein
MWATLGIVAIIALVAIGFITGIAWFALPVVLLAIITFFAVAGVLRSGQDQVARAESGPSPDFERPEDTPGGPEHKDTGHAYSGQERMIP